MGEKRMVSRETIVSWLDEELDVAHFNDVDDADFNGALVSGTEQVGSVGLCTNTTFENIETAVEQDCDLVLVHHGGWERFDRDLLEPKKDAMRDGGLTWYVAHQALDCADDYGVCVALADELGIAIEGRYCELQGGPHGRYGRLAVSRDEFLNRLTVVEPGYEVVGAIGDIESARIGIVGGGGGHLEAILQETIEIGCDVFVTGNSSFVNDIYAYEKGLTMITLEETSSEKWDVYVLGARLEGAFPAIETIELDERNW